MLPWEQLRVRKWLSPWAVTKPMPCPIREHQGEGHDGGGLHNCLLRDRGPDRRASGTGGPSGHSPRFIHRLWSVMLEPVPLSTKDQSPILLLWAMLLGLAPLPQDSGKQWWQPQPSRAGSWDNGVCSSPPPPPLPTAAQPWELPPTRKRVHRLMEVHSSRPHDSDAAYTGFALIQNTRARTKHNHGHQRSTWHSAFSMCQLLYWQK